MIKNHNNYMFKCYYIKSFLFSLKGTFALVGQGLRRSISGAGDCF